MKLEIDNNVQTTLTLTRKGTNLKYRDSIFRERDRNLPWSFQNRFLKYTMNALIILMFAVKYVNYSE